MKKKVNNVRRTGRPATREHLQTPQRMNPLVQAFSARLSAWRQETGKTLKEVSADTGLSTSILCEWEHGHRFPSVEHLQAIAIYTKIPASSFLVTKGAKRK